MRYGIFADVHANLEALDSVIEAYKNKNIDSYICLGDIVGYGADPSECIEKIKKLDADIVCGNHDWACAGVFPLDYFNSKAKAAIAWTQRTLDSEEKDFLGNLGLVVDKKDFSLVHGSLYRPDFFPYIIDAESAYKCFERMTNQLCFIGHSHVCMSFLLDKDTMRHSFDSVIDIKSGVKYIVNVGSVGQPRDNNPGAAFAVFDSEKKTIELNRVSYDIKKAAGKIMNAGLPERLADRLYCGQ